MDDHYEYYDHHDRYNVTIHSNCFDGHYDHYDPQDKFDITIHLDYFAVAVSYVLAEGEARLSH